MSHIILLQLLDICIFCCSLLFVVLQVIWAFAVNCQSSVIMSVSGLTGSPSRCCLRTSVGSLGSLKQVSAFPSSWKPFDEITKLHLESNCLILKGWSNYVLLLIQYFCFSRKEKINGSFLDHDAFPVAIIQKL